MGQELIFDNIWRSKKRKKGEKFLKKKIKKKRCKGRNGRQLECICASENEGREGT